MTETQAPTVRRADTVPYRVAFVLTRTTLVALSVTALVFYADRAVEGSLYGVQWLAAVFYVAVLVRALWTAVRPLRYFLTTPAVSRRKVAARHAYRQMRARYDVLDQQVSLMRSRALALSAAEAYVPAGKVGQLGKSMAAKELEKRRAARHGRRDAEEYTGPYSDICEYGGNVVMRHELEPRIEPNDKRERMALALLREADEMAVLDPRSARITRERARRISPTTNGR